MMGLPRHVPPKMRTKTGWRQTGEAIAKVERRAADMSQRRFKKRPLSFGYYEPAAVV